MFGSSLSTISHTPTWQTTFHNKKPSLMFHKNTLGLSNQSHVPYSSLFQALFQWKSLLIQTPEAKIQTNTSTKSFWRNEQKLASVTSCQQYNKAGQSSITTVTKTKRLQWLCLQGRCSAGSFKFINSWKSEFASFYSPTFRINSLFFGFCFR